MWWNAELQEQRRAVERARRTLEAGGPKQPDQQALDRHSAPLLSGWSVADAAALAFAVASIFGPLRAIRLALAAASAARVVRSLTSARR